MSEKYDHDRLSFLLDAAQRYGPVVELAPGTILVSGPQEAHEVLHRSNRDFLSTQNFLRTKIDGHLGAEGVQRWMAARKVAARTLSDPALLEAHRQHVRKAVREWIAHAWTGRSVSAGALITDLQRLTSESISAYCFGDRDTRDVPQRAQDMLDALFPVVASPFLPPRWLRRVRPRDLAVRRILRRLEESVGRAAVARGRGGMYEALVSAGLTTADATQMTISTLLAAHGVPASAMLWTLVELAWRPEIQTALAERTDRERLLGDVLRESLRLWPPSWLLGRDATADTQCNGWAIPQGWAVMVSSWVVHRVAPSFSDRPQEFLPERWNHVRPERGEYIPFGAGPRWCVGERFALMELQVMLEEITCSTFLEIDIAREGLVVNDRRTLTPEGFTLMFHNRPASRRAARRENGARPERTGE